MAAYEGLPNGGVLHLTQDQDAVCMYYTLDALHGTDALYSRYPGDAPEVWRVEIQRR